jgi:tetratricopeptide (TPR) repeat protein
MVRRSRRLAVAILVLLCWLPGVPMLASDEASVEHFLAAGRQASLQRHYGQAIRVLQKGLKQNPHDDRLELELGRAYLAGGSNRYARKLFREILAAEPSNRLAKLELARSLGYAREYEQSNRIYEDLLRASEADEAAAIGLVSNLLHEHRSRDALIVVSRALAFHSDSLRLQEYKDRVESGSLVGEERERTDPRNLVELGADYINDSAGNHSWRSVQGGDFGISSNLSNRFLFEQRFQHSRDDSFEAVEIFSEQTRWKPLPSLLLSAGGGAVRFNNHDVHAIYDVALAFQLSEHLVVGANFARVPVIPDAEATEHKLTAQGWESFVNWTPRRWQFDAEWSRQHYSDSNIASRQTAGIIREWDVRPVTLETGYRYRRYSFDEELEHGYFSPNSYQSHVAVLGVRGRVKNRYRGSLQIRTGMESASLDSPFRLAWEIYCRNEAVIGKWILGIDYTKYHVAQDTGAFDADAGRFTFTYRF